jgi:peroxiredoxin
MKIRLLAALLAAVALVAAGCTGKDAVDQSSGSQYRYVSANRLGQIDPPGDRKQAGGFTGDLLGGGKIKLADQAGKVVVLNFWATWCAPCVIETPQFDAVYRKYVGSDRAVQFIGIDTKDGRDAATSFVADNKISYPIVYDQRGETAVRLGKIPSLALPFTVLIDKQGRVAAVYLQQMSAKDLQTAVDSLLAET